MARDSTYVDPGALEWERTGDPGFWVKKLDENPARGERVLLMKLDPGASFPMHAHDGEWEHIFVLEGTFQDDQQTISKGQYVCRSPGAPHTTTTEDGAIVLLFYTSDRKTAPQQGSRD